jgi:hypothetical protein
MGSEASHASACPACGSNRGFGVSFGKDATREEGSAPTHWFCRDCRLLSRLENSQESGKQERQSSE